MKEYKILFDRETDGRWIASVKGLRGMTIHIYGATKAEACERAKEATLVYLSEQKRIPDQISFVGSVAA